MASKNYWKKSTRVDSVLSVLLVVLALAVLGVSAVETQIDTAEIAASVQAA